MKPELIPTNACFSSGPCAKRPGWELQDLKDAAVGRSHRSALGKGKLQEVIERTRSVLAIPADYRVGIVPASDTGAVEMALWSLLGPRGVDALAWESFSKGWVGDIQQQLKLEDVRVFAADYGEIPCLTQVDGDRDVVFAWNGTTSGVKVPDAEWISHDRKGLTICDATSAAFAMQLPWEKLDVITYSWQKVMGGEAAHGVLILGPRAVERLESYIPPWPLPKIFRLTNAGALNEGIFKGGTINTPSMLCIEDALDGLKWAAEIGGLAKLIERSEANLASLAAWVAQTDWIDFLAADERIRSNTSMCFKFAGACFKTLAQTEQKAVQKQLVGLLAAEEIAYDIGAYREAPAGLRIWGGATVATADIKALTQWLDWAFAEVIEPELVV
jgi:phosphoserine aminotransferase